MVSRLSVMARKRRPRAHMKWVIKDRGKGQTVRELYMSRKNQFIGVRSQALFSGAERWKGGRKEKTVGKYKRAVKKCIYVGARTRRS
jgi:hypothetical protein